MKNPGLRFVWFVTLLLVLRPPGGFAASAESPRTSLRQAMAARPADPWPRGRGHVVLGDPGTPEDWKAYLEPGGSFSPAFASFGVSLWIVDNEGRLITTSDALPLNAIAQRWVWPSQPVWPRGSELPGVETTTPHYVATWSLTGPGRSQLHLQTRGTNSLWIMIRSAGPAGAPLRALQRSGDRVFVSDRWAVSLRGRGADLEVAPPGAADPGQTRAPRYFWPAEQPWGYARYRLLTGQEYWLTIEDSVRPPASPLPTVRSRSNLKLDLPDDRFAACLEAQVAQLLMGLVGRETRPGDPNNYPLNWLRDGAYVIAALARSGQMSVARELSLPFAEHDFFGGFGAEADAPGLALWALDEVSARLRDRAFDQALWPHVQRKAALLQQMLETTTPIRQPFVGPVVPAYSNRADLDLVCEPARDGLIVGRMDWHRPLLFVNAVSYLGFQSAARLAERLEQGDAAVPWRRQATALQSAWQRALETAEARNERTYACGLFPSWVVARPETYRSLLEARRRETHDTRDQLRGRPKWTYFNLAEAHQWLLLGQPARPWNDLTWFWAHQASPGLYSWWEGDGEENTFGRWEQARGWVRPEHVTPHYWTAAAMLLLQLDMLTYLDESGPEPILVVGGGIPSAWVEKTLRVQGMSTRLGRVDWEWTKGRMTVRQHDTPVEVRFGAAFPADAPLRLKD